MNSFSTVYVFILASFFCQMARFERQVQGCRLVLFNSLLFFYRFISMHSLILWCFRFEELKIWDVVNK